MQILNDWPFILEKTSQIIGIFSSIVTIIGFKTQKINKSKVRSAYKDFFHWRYVTLMVALLCFGLVYVQGKYSVNQSTVAKSTAQSLPMRGRLEVSGIELSPPVKDAWVRVKAFVGEDTFIFPSTGTKGWLPVSETWNGQSVLFSANPKPTIQFEITVIDRQSGATATLLSGERVPYEGENKKAFYSVSGADPTAPNASGARRANIAYQVQPVF